MVLLYVEVISMAYFLKKSKIKERIYLQIYESFYDPKRGHTAHRSFKAIGYVDNLISEGIKDPLTHFKNEVDLLNEALNVKKQEEKVKLISDSTPEKYLGHFPIKALNDGLNIKGHLDLLQSSRKFEFNVYDILSSLIYARMIKPVSKSKTFHDVVPLLFDAPHFSSSQMYSALEFVGSEYQKIIEIYNQAIQKQFPFDTSSSYFDCTNFYFDIDQEDELRRKGPSKENRKEPIIGMGLLLDAHQVPMGMKLFPGNQSEQKIIGNVISDLKRRQNITGRTIRVADKGLNSAHNITQALKENDGYIFSKSIIKLPETEKVWVLLDNDYTDVYDKNGKLKYRIKECIDTFEYDVIIDNKKMKVKTEEKRIVSYNPQLAKKQIIEMNKQIEKARKYSSRQLKKSDIGDHSKCLSFSANIKTGEIDDDHIVVTSLNLDKIERDKQLAGYNMIVTSEVKMSSEEVYNTYHNLWRIEESFRIMKSYLDARPVYVQKQDSIFGHFLICYLSIVLLRIFENHILEEEYCGSEILKFIREFKVVQLSPRKYVNITRTSKFIDDLTFLTNLPLNVYHLNNTQIKMMLNHRF